MENIVDTEELQQKEKREEKWRGIIDFTKIRKGGVSMQELLLILKGEQKKHINIFNHKDY